MSFDIFWEKLDNEMAKKVQDILTNHFRNSANKPSFIGDIVISDFHFGTLPPSIEINNITDPRMNSANSTTSGLSNSYGIGGIGTSSPSIIDDYHNSEYLYYQQRLLREQRQHQDHLPYSHHNNNLHNHHLLHSTLPHHNLGENIIDNFDNVDSFESMMISEDVEEASSIKKHDTDAQLHISIDYKGDMRMVITTELYMNYPSMMFMSLPIRLTITGFEFSATAVIAYLKRRINFCFLEPKNPEER
ncbi:4965_t:CDS:2 [Diversispora eburnea]|uniref:4965_t:CDS:1 n=1 Tax=Diversispora eburnea TaxID=1213867 RepID=A0A9N8VCP7_9GLOM|nr:4965_t:CDS:2 [Diversispora eburnea]